VVPIDDQAKPTDMYKYYLSNSDLNNIKFFLDDIDRSILLQVLEGIKPSMNEIINQLQFSFPNKIFYLSTEPCTGACCAPTFQISQASDIPWADKVIHFGAVPIPYLVPYQQKVLFINIISPLPTGLVKTIANILRKKEFKSICLTTSETYLSHLNFVSFH